MASGRENKGDDTMHYNQMVEDAFRSVVRKSIEKVMELGELPDKHHFYITFLTDYKGVQIPDYLRERYPGEMTIVLQYQFSDLSVDDENLLVTLSFHNKPEHLVVPLKSISIFADPSVNFALQFQPTKDEDGTNDDKSIAIPRPPNEAEINDPNKQTAQVVSLDKFRKKDD